VDGPGLCGVLGAGARFTIGTALATAAACAAPSAHEVRRRCCSLTGPLFPMQGTGRTVSSSTGSRTGTQGRAPARHIININTDRSGTTDGQRPEPILCAMSHSPVGCRHHDGLRAYGLRRFGRTGRHIGSERVEHQCGYDERRFDLCRRPVRGYRSASTTCSAARDCRGPRSRRDMLVRRRRYAVPTVRSGGSALRHVYPGDGDRPPYGPGATACCRRLRG